MGEVNRRGYWGVLPGEVKRDAELTIAAKYLYIILSSMAYDDGYCWPSNEYLAGEIGLSKRRVVELLALLRDRGYIRITMQTSAASHTGEQRLQRLFDHLDGNALFHFWKFTYGSRVWKD